MAGIKQAILTIGVIGLAAGVLAAMVIYSVTVMRTYERRILTGELTAAQQTQWNFNR